MKTLLLFLWIFNIPANLFTGGEVTNIRGNIILESTDSKMETPLSGAKLDLYRKSGEEWLLIESTTTDRYGMYYFYNLVPATYYLQVNGKKNYEIKVKKIDYRVVQFQDIATLVYS